LATTSTDLEDEKSGTPRLVRHKVFSTTPRLCPVCLTPLQKIGELGGWLIPQNYLCPKCGYNGIAFLEETPEDEKRPQKATD